MATLATAASLSHRLFKSSTTVRRRSLVCFMRSYLWSQNARSSVERWRIKTAEAPGLR